MNIKEMREGEGETMKELEVINTSPNSTTLCSPCFLPFKTWCECFLLEVVPQEKPNFVGREPVVTFSKRI